MSNGILIALLVVMTATVVVLAYAVVAILRRLADMTDAWGQFLRSTQEELVPTLRDLRDTLNQASAAINHLHEVTADVGDMVEKGKDLWEGARVGIEATKAVKNAGTSAFDYIVALKRGLQALRGHTEPAGAKKTTMEEE